MTSWRSMQIKTADDFASVGHVMSTKMADDLISADSMAPKLTLTSECKQMTKYVNKHGGWPNYPR